MVDPTSDEVWTYIDAITEDFALVCFSNGGAVGFEAAKAYTPSRCVVGVTFAPTRIIRLAYRCNGWMA